VEDHNDGSTRELASPDASMTSSSINISRYRSAIEGYVPAISGRKLLAIGSAAPAFADYLIRVHARIHPIFSDSTLGALDRLPPSHPLNDNSLRVTLELVIDDQGRLARLGVVQPSGRVAFDVIVLHAVESAAPFEPPPAQVLSSDRLFYLHWSFARDTTACSTMNARPYLLAPAQTGARTAADATLVSRSRPR
jgi:TonB family protein